MNAPTGTIGITVPDYAAPHIKYAALHHLHRPGKPGHTVVFPSIRIIIVLNPRPAFHAVNTLHIHQRTVPGLPGVLKIPIHNRPSVQNNVLCGKTAAVHSQQYLPCTLHIIIFTLEILVPAHRSRISPILTAKHNALCARRQCPGHAAVLQDVYRIPRLYIGKSLF